MVFLSWSGDRSQRVAMALRGWLPTVIQEVKRFISSEDIPKGALWAPQLFEVLKDVNFGILCLTPENLSAPWLHFEAGALSKGLDTSRVCPLLVGMDTEDVEYPLAAFNMTVSTKKDINRLIQGMNNALPEPLDNAILTTMFETFWPRLDAQLREVESESEPGEPHKRSARDLAAETLKLVREQSTLLSQIQRYILFPPEVTGVVFGSSGPFQYYTTKPNFTTLPAGTTVDVFGPPSSPYREFITRMASEPEVTVILQHGSTVSIGDTVTHPRYGSGKIRHIGNDGVGVAEFQSGLTTNIKLPRGPSPSQDEGGSDTKG